MAATRTSDIRTGPERPQPRDRRRWSRYNLNGALPAVLVSETGRLACHIENVSLSGARLRLPVPSCPPGELRLDYGGATGPSGRCAWASADGIGLNFGFSADALALTMACLRGALPASGAP